MQTPSNAHLQCHFRIMREAARTQLSADAERRLGAALEAPGVDWAYLIGFARYHGALALLYTHVKGRFEDVVPPAALNAMRGLVMSRSVLSLTLSQELGRLTVMFESEGIPAIALKGATIAQRVYGSLALRPFVDMDLLVRRRDYDRVEALLVRERYERKAMTPFQKAAYLLVHAQYTFWRGRSTAYPLTIDLHTGVVPLGYSFSSTFDELWDRRRSITIGGQPVPTVGDEDLLIILCYHGFKNRWDRLKYITDVAEVVRELPDLDWEAIDARARQMRCQRVLQLGLMLAETLLDAPVPERVSRAAHADRRVRTLHDEVIGRLPEEAHIAVEPYWDRVRLNLYGQDRWTGRVRYGGYSLLRRVSELVVPE